MNKTPWRSLGDSNPCFRRERDTLPPLAVRSRPAIKLNQQ